MADIQDFFSNFLPNKLSENPKLAPEINEIYQFDIEGAGTWSVDLTDGAGSVANAAHEKASCTVTAKQADFETLLDNPNQAPMLFMMGKLKVSNITLATRLQELLS